jgi:hypothetical protein
MASIEDLSGRRLLFVETDYHRVWAADTNGANKRVLDDVTVEPALDWAPLPMAFYT